MRGQFGALLDSYQFKTLHSVLDCTIDEIRPVDDRFEVRITYTHADGEQAVLDYESVIKCAGFRMDTSIFDPACRPEMIRDGRDGFRYNLRILTARLRNATRASRCPAKWSWPIRSG